MSDRDDFGAFLIGFVVGGLTGAVAALLLAPQSGEETRALIKDKGIELRDKAVETADQTKVKVEKYAADAKVKGQELIDSAKKAVAKKKPGEPTPA
jgi:gas vesicle protein